MPKNNTYIRTVENLIDKYFVAVRIPLAILDKNNITHYCKPLCDENTWPSKNNYFCLEYYSFNEIKSPTMIIKDDEFYFGIIPLDNNMYVTVGPIMHLRYTLSELFFELSDMYTENEIVTYYHANSESGHMDSFRFSNIFALLSGSLLHVPFSPEELYTNRIPIEGTPFLFNVEGSETTNEKATVNPIILKDSDSPFSIKCNKYIQSHLKEKITAAGLSDALNISDRTLYRLFKQHFNMSLNDYIHHMKIDRSIEMLIETDLTISEVSAYWGYSSQSHYNKAFEKILGKTPGEFRKMHKKSGHT